MKYFFIVALFSFSGFRAYAVQPLERDSVPVATGMNRQWTQHYENDDTAKAIVRFYELKRRSTQITTALLFAATAAAGFAYDKASRDPDPNDPLNEGAGFRSLFAFLLLLLLIPVSLISFINMFRFNRKQQARRLASYAGGKPVSKWITESRIFKNYLRKQ